MGALDDFCQFKVSNLALQNIKVFAVNLPIKILAAKTIGQLQTDWQWLTGYGGKKSKTSSDNLASLFLVIA